jgi:hypothetical protein
MPDTKQCSYHLPKFNPDVWHIRFVNIISRRAPFEVVLTDPLCLQEIMQFHYFKSCWKDLKPPKVKKNFQIIYLESMRKS